MQAELQNSKEIVFEEVKTTELNVDAGQVAAFGIGLGVGALIALT